MNESELLTILARGEDSHHQFKRDISNADGLTAELIAFANTAGGRLFIGVADGGQVFGLDAAAVARLNQLLSNAASQHVRPPINPVSTNVQTKHGLVMVIDVAEGLNKPYVDTQGRIWVKSGADKRHVTAREEMQRLFQSAGLVYADEVPVRQASVDDLDLAAFSQYFGRRYRESVEARGLPLPQMLHNLNLARDGVPNLAGYLLFGKAPQILKPAFVVKAVAFPGTALHDSRYLDSEDIDGNLPEQYRRGMAFIKRNLRHVQGNQGFNSPGMLEVPEAVFEELLVNALVHRDYFVSAPVRLLIFSDRVEIISPGHLPNHLDIQQIRFGLSNLRNPALSSHAFHMLPYRGLGSGIPRATLAWPHIDLVDDRQGNQFKAVVHRDLVKQTMPQKVMEAIAEGSVMAVLSRDQAKKRPESQPEWEPESKAKTEEETELQPDSKANKELQPESRPESRPESIENLPMEPESKPDGQPESLEGRVLQILAVKPASKAEISAYLGQKEVSGRLNEVIRNLIAAEVIAYTVPEKPHSRLQKYRLRA